MYADNKLQTQPKKYIYTGYTQLISCSVAMILQLLLTNIAYLAVYTCICACAQDVSNTILALLAVDVTEWVQNK